VNIGAPSTIVASASNQLTNIAKEHDFSFDFTVANRLVCTEVIYRAYDGVEGTLIPLSMRAGRLTLAALELVEMAMQRKHFAIEATYIHMLSNKLLRRTEAIEAVKRVSRTLQDKGNHGDRLLSNS
jgi:hypothetical protein